MNQSSLFAFDTSAKKEFYKVITGDSRSKRIKYVEAFSEAELQQQFPEAKIRRVD